VPRCMTVERISKSLTTLTLTPPQVFELFFEQFFEFPVGRDKDGKIAPPWAWGRSLGPGPGLPSHRPGPGPVPGTVRQPWTRAQARVPGPWRGGNPSIPTSTLPAIQFLFPKTVQSTRGGRGRGGYFSPYNYFYLNEI
jgi:hypothetical protein